MRLPCVHRARAEQVGITCQRPKSARQQKKRLFIAKTQTGKLCQSSELLTVAEMLIQIFERLARCSLLNKHLFCVRGFVWPCTLSLPPPPPAPPDPTMARGHRLSSFYLVSECRCPRCQKYTPKNNPGKG